MTVEEVARGMDFVCERRTARFYSPLKNFELDEQVIEHRLDPLTSQRSIVLKGRRDYVKRYVQTDEPLLVDTVERTRGACPFCPGKAETSTPRFPLELVPEGVIRSGEARTFPSLFAHTEFNAVTVITNSHYVRPKDLTAKLLADALEATTRYLRIVHDKNPHVEHGAILMNFLPPAGSTVVHPHMQALASDQAFNMLAEVDTKAREYWKAKNSNYWNDLIAAEKAHKERYLGSIGHSDWVMAYSPSGFDEVWGILRNLSDLTQLSTAALSDLAEGMSRVLNCYDGRDIRSFNAVVFSSPFGQNSPHGSVILKIASRYGFQSQNLNDIWGLRYFLGQSEVFDCPEDVASQLCEYFREA